MLWPLAFILGFALGWQRATKRGGDRFDKLQYGAVHGIIFVLAALVALFAVQWLGWA